MATREQIRALQTAQPFRPFRVWLANKQEYVVRHPELISISYDSRSIILHDQEGIHFLEGTQVDLMELLQQEQPTQAPQGGGNGPGSA
jgi:hypothetical protein